MIWTFKIVDFLQDPLKDFHKVPVKDGMTVVDYGCGPGRYTIALAKAVGPHGKVYAVDIQPIAIGIVEQKAAEASVLGIVEGVVVEGFNTGIQDSSVDLIYFRDAMHGIENTQALFKEFRRLLKNDGRIFLDPGHMRMSKARDIIRGTGEFRIESEDGKDLIVAPIQ